jgi:hypothetical protein
MENAKALYFDVSVFRKIIRILSYWQELEKFFDREEPGLLDNSNVLFTWSLLMEACDLGKILNQIPKTDIWKSKIEGRKIIEEFGFQKGLDIYFSTAVEALNSLSELQKDSLLKRIDKTVSHAAPEAKNFVANTLLRYRESIASHSYMISLAVELAWAFLTSHPFIQSKDQWDKRKICYESLIALWHRLHKQGHDLVLFRLTERHYHSYLLHSPDVNMEEAKILYPGILSRQDLADRIFKFSPLKQGSDLCDGEIIHFTYLGNQGLPVVSIAKGEQSQVNQRMGIFDRCLSDLKFCVTDWNLEIILGMIFSIKMDDKGEIQYAYRNLPRAACGTL